MVLGEEPPQRAEERTRASLTPHRRDENLSILVVAQSHPVWTVRIGRSHRPALQVSSLPVGVTRCAHSVGRLLGT